MFCLLATVGLCRTVSPDCFWGETQPGAFFFFFLEEGLCPVPTRGTVDAGGI